MSTKDEQEILTLEHYLQLKSEGFEFEGQSYLFWEYMRLLNECNPQYFLLENVEMGEKWEKVLSKAIGVNGIHINSALVSAQNRKRIYWTNIGMKPSGLFGDLQSIIEQPKDRGILLKDILETEVDQKYYLSEKLLNHFNNKSSYSNFKFDFKPTDGEKKGACLTASMGKMPITQDYIVHNMMPRSGNPLKGGTGHLTRNDGKTYCLDTGNTNAVEIVAMRGREAVLTPKRTEYGKAIRKDYEAGNIKTQRKNIQQLEPRSDGKTNCLTSVQKDNLVIQLNPSKESGGKQPYQHNRFYDINGIAPCLNTDTRSPAIQMENNNLVLGCDYRNDEGFRFRENGKSGTLAARARNDESCGQLAQINKSIRRLTPVECERLQTVPDNYTNHVSDSQRYKMLGNGWTVDVISYIFSYIES
jgi:DNA (cytosine-5)-methyltransferase 3A